jgi:hypothetical protein
VGKEQLKERCGLEPRTNFFPFKKSPKTECGLDSRIYGIPSSGNAKSLIKDVLLKQNLLTKSATSSYSAHLTN